MARPAKGTVDYFPHFVTGGKTLFILENDFGNDGYAFWFKLLEVLGNTEGMYFDWKHAPDRRFLLSKTRVDEETALQIIGTLIDVEAIDKELWDEHRVIWCQNLVDNVKDAFKKRTSLIPQKPEFPSINVVSAPETPVQEEFPVEETGKGKERESKGKGKGNKDSPPKTQFAEFVTMTEEEHRKLVDEYGHDKTLRMIEILNGYKGSKGKTYKSDYLAIKNWVIDRVNEESARNVQKKSKNQEQFEILNEFYEEGKHLEENGDSSIFGRGQDRLPGV
jgi:hypothetical protein